MNNKCNGMKIFGYVLICLALAFVAACSQSSSAPPAEPPPQTNNTGSAEGNAGNSNAGGAAFPTTLEEVAVYDRTQNYDKLIEAAKAEGALTLYTSTPVDDIKKVTDAFTAKYGIPVTTWRSSSESVLQRVTTEAQGGVNAVDAIAIVSTDLEAMSREKLLQQVESPYHQDLVAIALPEHKEWVGTDLFSFVYAYNTNKVKAEDLPKSYEDLLDPKWKGQLAVEGSDFYWLAQIVKDMGEEKGIQYFKDLVATNGVSVRDGHSLLAELVASGEVPLGLTVYNWKAEQMKQLGAPLDWFTIDPTLTIPNGIAVSNKAPHPNAAVLFYDFLLSDGQQILADMMYAPASTKVDSAFKDLKLRLIEPIVILDEYDKWFKLWDEVILRNASIK